MRIALLYPPPWKISEPGTPADPVHGPPADFRPGDLDSDFYQTPYGLFSLGAEAIRAGHRVKVFNLSSFAWRRVEEVIAALDADVFGMSCWTANRRGVALTAALIRQHHPAAHIVIGGPHATPLAEPMLLHHPEIDTVCLGESDESFLELVERLERGRDTAGIAGTVYRTESGVARGASRPAIAELDRLECPHRHFDTHIVMTSRGCPWACTFCGAETTWGRGFRGQSVSYVLDALEHALERLPVKMLQIKDDTFTANKKRVLALCRGIRERGLNFLWSCDTRVDVLSEELLREMRLAGCQRLSLGVESGSQRILDAINKKISVDEIIASTEAAKRYGIHARYYMMLGNRGETAETFRETLTFLERARPHQYIFSCLSIFPGTADYTDAVRAGVVSPETYFTGDFQELKVPFDASAEDTALMNAWFLDHNGIRDDYVEDVEAARATLSRLGDHHAAHLDLAGAHFRADDLDAAELHARRALELGYPAPGLVYNYLACIAWRRGDVQKMQDHFMTAARTDPQHYVLIQNVEATRRWFKERGPERGLPLALTARHDFQLLERTRQPTLPGPLPEDFDDWDAAPLASAAAGLPRSSEVMPEGHERAAFGARRLPMV
jgi:radical SAM superfamily enzyme YgiQ (UPF0313 family)